MIETIQNLYGENKNVQIQENALSRLSFDEDCQVELNPKDPSIEMKCLEKSSQCTVDQTLGEIDGEKLSIWSLWENLPEKSKYQCLKAGEWSKVFQTNCLKKNFTRLATS